MIIFLVLDGLIIFISLYLKNDFHGCFFASEKGEVVDLGAAYFLIPYFLFLISYSYVGVSSAGAMRMMVRGLS
jgi:hypothetical protein